MKLTRDRLKQIIKEELEEIMSESDLEEIHSGHTEKGGDDERSHKSDDPHDEIAADTRRYKAMQAQIAKQRAADEKGAAEYYARQAREKDKRDAERAARATRTK